MSFDRTRTVFDKTKAKRAAQLVLLRLADHENVKRGPVPIKISTLVEETGYSYNTVRRALAELVSLGEIEVKAPDGGGPATYRILIKPRRARGGQGSAPKTRDRSSKTREGSAHGGQGARPSWAGGSRGMGAQEPGFEPRSEPRSEPEEHGARAEEQTQGERPPIPAVWHDAMRNVKSHPPVPDVIGLEPIGEIAGAKKRRPAGEWRDGVFIEAPAVDEMFESLNGHKEVDK